LDAAKAAGAVTLNIGVFLNTVIQFLIVGFAVFWVVKGLSKLTVTKKAEAVAEPPPPPPPTPSELLLTEIRDLLAQKSA